MNTDPVIRQLVRHWGDMARRWGISRIVAEIHALLFFSARPITADEIVQALGVARSHVSNGLKELQSWGVIRGMRVPGDRREHFESIEDIWQLFEVLMDERKRRELDPTLKLLRETMTQMNNDDRIAPGLKGRVRQMLDFHEAIDRWYGEIRRMPLAARVGLLKLGGKVAKWLK